MPISELELMELFADTIMQATKHFPDDSLQPTSYFIAPSTELAAKSITLSDMIGDNPTMLSALSKSWAGQGHTASAGIATKIETFLNSSSGGFGTDKGLAPRPLGFVYPVV